MQLGGKGLSKRTALHLSDEVGHTVNTQTMKYQTIHSLIYAAARAAELLCSLPLGAGSDLSKQQYR
jgi:hypothetical protein